MRWERVTCLFGVALGLMSLFMYKKKGGGGGDSLQNQCSKIKIKSFCLSYLIELSVNIQHLRVVIFLITLHLIMQDLYRNILRNGSSQDGHVFSGASANFIAGSAAGCTTMILIYPLDIAHTRLAADIGRNDVRQFRGIYHFLSIICKKDGIRGIYRGLHASVQGMIVHRGFRRI